MTAASPSRRSLLRAEARERAANLDVASVRIELDLTDPSGDTFGSRSTLEFASSSPRTFVDFQGRQLVSAALNGYDLDPAAWREGRIPLDGLQPQNTLVVEGRMAYSTDGEGLHRHVDPSDRSTYLYAMSFLDAAPRWFACFDQPDLKASYRFDVAAPHGWTVLGNGPSTTVQPGRWTIQPTRPLSTYFVTLVAGPYASVLAEHDGIRLGFHTRASLRPQLEAEVADLLTVTRQSFDYYHRIFGLRYPFGEYHQAFVPDFNAGAMENPGCVTLRDSYLYRGRATETDRGARANVIAHEMAHQWFGDLVSMRWWDDLWLNESFAEYLAYRCCGEATRYRLWTDFGIRRKYQGMVADQSPSTHPVAGNGSVDAAAALQAFDGISYSKGASVLSQLVSYVGDEVFLAGLRDYFDRYAFGNAEFADLISCLTRAGASGLEQWAAAWLRTAGMDTLDVVGHRPEVSLTATGPDLARSPRTHAVTVGSVDAAGTVQRIADLALRGRADGVSVPDEGVLVVPDVTDSAWAKVRFGAAGWSDVARVLPVLTDEPVLVVVHNAIRDAVRDGTLDPLVALDLICGSAGLQQSDTLLTGVLSFAAAVLAGPFSPMAERAARLGRVHGLARQITAASSPGSDQQLTGFRLSVASAADTGVLQAWSQGRDLPAGLELDAELSWLIVARLVAVGGDPAAINLTLEGDPSSSARVHAARAWASVPTPEAKAAAWAVLMQPSSSSAYEVYAAADGFFLPGQERVTDPYVERYFAEIGATAGFRHGWALGQVAKQAFPRLAVDERTLDLAEATLRTGLADALQRELVDGLDQLQRALASLRNRPPGDAR